MNYGTSVRNALERGEELAAICQRWLDGARARVDAARQARTEDPQATRTG